MSRACSEDTKEVQSSRTLPFLNTMPADFLFSTVEPNDIMKYDEPLFRTK